ncbi:GNAT family N-acetyltransferase [Streptomyces maremycinicus]|uniref:GNAT family N-acetyltransferase n=1 Tax=Streptomyces maremycinicus TaxID=1679753 RepID=UPI001F42F347|nr:GNAT family N-acetyltransferase [Streptomyces sp. NBRC 110468]
MSEAHGRTGSGEDAAPRRVAGRHRRTGRRAGRWHRRLLAYRDVELLPSSSLGGGPNEECLLLVHIRKIVGRVTYRACDECAEGVITDVVLDEPFRDCGLGTRALSHLRSRHPDVTWRTTLDRRLTRDLLHRMRIPRAAPAANCSHGRPGGMLPAAG